MGVLLVCGLLALGLFSRRTTQTPSASATSAPRPGAVPPLSDAPAPTLAPTVARSVAPGVTDLVRATVQIRVPMDGVPGRSSSGSASVITSSGHLLTNAHVLFDDRTDQPYNARGQVFVAVTTDEHEPPNVLYQARLVERDAAADLALLKIERRADGGALPGDFRLPTIALGSSNKVALGETLTILGYPGLGGATITLVKGTVSGFETDASGPWIKTDAEINPGNSGGPAVNALGEQVGIASAVVSSNDLQKAPGKLGLVRPLTTAKALIERARQEAGE